MSANRIVLRKAWIAECPPIFERAKKRRAVRDKGARTSYGNRMPFHTWAVLRKHRHRLFHARRHEARVEAGLYPTSASQRVHGKRV